jgi:hypothetical protein
MTHINTAAPLMSSLPKRMLAGAIIGLIVISFFVFGVNGAPAEWGVLWRVKPLIITPLAGAMGGLVYSIIYRVRQQFGWNKLLVNIFSALIFLVILWLGVVLGLNGTMWN